MDTTPLDFLAVITSVVITAFLFNEYARWARAKRRLRRTR